MNDVEFLIKAFFESYRKYLSKIDSLIADSSYLSIGFLCLCCFIDNLSSIRYPNSEVKKRFINLLSKYYDGDEFKKIDLLFFYQWERNDDIKINSKSFLKKLNNNYQLYLKIKSRLEKEWTEAEIKGNNSIRYQSINSIIEFFPEENLLNLEKYLNLFSNANILYFFGRCQIVHQGHTLLLTIFGYPEQSSDVHHRENHLINPSLLMNILRKIIDKMECECVQQKKFPWDLVY